MVDLARAWLSAIRLIVMGYKCILKKARIPYMKEAKPNPSTIPVQGDCEVITKAEPTTNH